MEEEKSKESDRKMWGVAAALCLLMVLIYSAMSFDSIRMMLETPVRDMKIGQVVALIMFSWVLFK